MWRRPAPPFADRRGTRHRGSAAIEAMLSLPVLFLCVLAIVDFGRGFAAKHLARRAARQASWTASRHADASDRPRAPTADVLQSVHFRARAKDVRLESNSDSAQGGALARGPEADLAFPAFGGGAVQPPGRDVIPFLLGVVPMDRAVVRARVPGFRVLDDGAIAAAHSVSLRSSRETDPGDPEGWWDPLEFLTDQLGDHFRSIGGSGAP